MDGFVALRARFLLALLGLAIVTSAQADADPLDMSTAVFVSLAGSSTLAFIDPATDRIAGHLQAGLVPRQMAIAAPIGKLLVIDGKAADLTIIDVLTGNKWTVALDLVPDRMTVSNDGLTAALADTGDGHVVLVDLLRRKMLGSADHLPRLTDMAFSVDSRVLYLAGEHRGAIDVLDAADARPQSAIASGLPSGSLALGVSPNGRELFVQPAALGGIGVLDLEHERPLAPIPAATATTIAFPSATGAYLLMVDNGTGMLTIMPDNGVQAPARLEAATGVDIVYTAWFDTLALIPSTTARSVMMFDIETRMTAGNIPLGAAPARGAVTPDGGKLYLPLPAAKQVVAIDAQHRTLAATIAMPGEPTAVVLAGSYGLCH